ncbi:MAG: VTT domain-containing protein [Tetrasphaera sp.]|nr:VTT domain-containing protein [Tetrasphaera sp.]
MWRTDEAPSLTAGYLGGLGDRWEHVQTVGHLADWMAAVFLGRWTAFFRAVMPALAGVSRMPYRRFLIWNAAGGIVWGVVVVVVGYLAGLSYDRAAAWLGGGATAVVAVIVIGALTVWHVRRRQREKALEHEPAGA